MHRCGCRTCFRAAGRTFVNYVHEIVENVTYFFSSHRAETHRVCSPWFNRPRVAFVELYGTNSIREGRGHFRQFRSMSEWVMASYAAADGFYWLVEVWSA